MPPPQEWPTIASLEKSTAPCAFAYVGTFVNNAPVKTASAAMVWGVSKARCPAAATHLKLAQRAASVAREAEATRRRGAWRATGGGSGVSNHRLCPWAKTLLLQLPSTPSTTTQPSQTQCATRDSPSFRWRMTSTAASTSAILYSHLRSSTAPLPRPENMRQLPSASCVAPCEGNEVTRVCAVS